MNIRHLRIFKEVSDAMSITKASENLYISQPAVSSTIKELEEYIGLVLFDRIGRTIVLNESGKLFLSKVNTLLELYDELEDSVEWIKDSAPIRIGASITIAMSDLPLKIQEFNQPYPDIKVSVSVKNAKDIEAMIESNDIDFALIEGSLFNENLIQEKYNEYNLKLVVSNKHPLALKKKISLEELLEEDLLLREVGSAIRDVFDSTLLIHQKKCEPIWTSINSQVLIKAVKEGLGVTILPEVLVKEYLLNKEMVKLSVEDISFKNQMSIIYNKDKVLTTPMKELMGIIKEIK